jgi:hypothetical protein
MSQNNGGNASATPSLGLQKVAAGGLNGAVSTVITWALDTYLLPTPLPDIVVGAATIIIIGLLVKADLSDMMPQNAHAIYLPLLLNRSHGRALYCSGGERVLDCGAHRGHQTIAE